MSYWGYPRYVTVAEKKARAAKKLKQLKKKNPGLEPVIIEGRTIAGSWWGKSWNRNLEGYADYENRIGRGRSYVRNGYVLDLKVDSGSVKALVAGTARNPYSVCIKIKSIPKKHWQKITKECEGRLESLQELLIGKFPRALSEVFMARGKGLFPSPDEIEFSCSCPDWAYMCKHVAAALYAIGARLDEDPGLFFKLRKVEITDLVSRAVEERTHELLKKAVKKSSKIMDSSNLSEVFGIDLDENIAAETKKTKPLKKPSKKSKLPDNKKDKKSAQVKAKSKSRGETAVDIVAGAIGKSRKGVTVAVLKKRTGLTERKIYGAVQSLKKKGRIKKVSRGVYSVR